VLKIIATCKSPLSLPRCGQYEVTDGLLRQTGGFCCYENDILEAAVELERWLDQWIMMHVCFFLWGGLQGQHPKGNLRYLMVNSNLRYFCPWHQDGTKKRRRYNHPTWSLGKLLAAFPWGSQQDLERSWQTWPNHRS